MMKTKHLYRLNFFGYHRDIYDTFEKAKKECDFELSMMPFRQWSSKGYLIQKWENMNFITVYQNNYQCNYYIEGGV